MRSPPKKFRMHFVEGLGHAASRTAGRLMPDPFVLAVLLTLMTLILSVTMGADQAEKGLWDRISAVVVQGWFPGLTGKGGLAFAFQMVLVLITGHALALSPPIRSLLDVLSRVPRTAAQAAAIVALTACVAGYLHWGLGAVAGAMLAREIGRAWRASSRILHYPLLGAAAYSGMMVWHGGLSGSAPLKVAEPGHFLEGVTGVISVDQTLFSIMNITVMLALTLTAVGLYALLTPSEAGSVGFSGELAKEIRKTTEIKQTNQTDPRDSSSSSPQHPLVRWLECSPAIPLVLGLLIFGFLAQDVWAKGFGSLNLNTLNAAFLGAGILLHGSPRSYVNAAAEGARGTVGIVLQFPLYFGILGMLKTSGLVVQLSDFFVSIATATTLPVLVYLSSGLVNLFVPSGGGQWAVQGPVVMEAARALGADPNKVLMALAYGDAWTNLLQPFWALPLLGIMGLKARDIIGYTTLLLLVTGPLTIVLLLLL